MSDMQDCFIESEVGNGTKNRDEAANVVDALLAIAMAINRLAEVAEALARKSTEWDLK